MRKTGVSGSHPSQRVQLAALCLALALPACAPEPPAGRNVLLISIDTLRADRVGLYGNERGLTPHIDAFFGAGTVFESAWSSAPCTVPSVREFMRGRFASEDAPDVPLAQALRRNGWRTGAMVSQHNFVSGGKPKPAYSLGFEDFDVSHMRFDAHGMAEPDNAALTDRALAWLEQSDPGAPFFLWIHYFDPHDPHVPPPGADIEPGPGVRYDGGDVRRYLKDVTPEGRDWRREGAHFNAAEVDYFVRLYEAEVAEVDRQVGRVLEWLTTSGALPRTAVVLLADHGEHLGDDGVWDHCLDLSDEELRVPLLFRVDGGPLGAAARVAAPASTLDVLPTLLALLALPYDASDLDGVDLASAPPDRLVWSHDHGSFRARTRDVQLTAEPGEPLAWLDLAAAPARPIDLPRSDPEHALRLERELAAFLARHPDDAQVGRRIRERLRAIGYLD